MQIEIDFEVFKDLTARRQHEGHTYNEVLRDLLGLKPDRARTTSEAIAPIAPSGKHKSFVLRGGELVEGTELRAVYKGTEYRATIRDGRWIDDNGKEHSSPSAAATAISNTNVNGLRFWSARRPTDREFIRLDFMLANQR